MTVTKRKRGTKVNRKTPHGDSGRAVVREKGRSSAKATSVYSALNGNFRVFYPVGMTRASNKTLASKIRRGVATMKD